MADSDCMQHSVSNTSLGFLPFCVMSRESAFCTPTAIHENVIS